MKSRKPEAQQFEEWLFAEVLPSIRKTGYYAMPQMTEMQMIGKIANAVDVLQTQMGQYNNRLDAQDNRLNELETWKEDVNEIFRQYGLTGRMTIRGYAQVNNIALNNNQAKFLGGEATKVTRAMGLEPAQVPDPRYGIVNSYPKYILDDVFSRFMTSLQA